ncbi:MAG: homoserine dehydrogenase [Chloroflexota bacterium]
MKRVPVIIFGAGGVGQALMKQIVHGRTQALTRNQCHFDIIAVADSQSCLWSANGLTDEQLLTLIQDKRAGRPVNSVPEERPTDMDILETAVAASLENVTIVDVTAAAGMEPVIDRALDLQYSVVLANKKPLAGPWIAAKRYFDHPRLRHESTVGGGQPVIATLRYLLDVNDTIYEITGQLSGSLGFMCGRLDKDDTFSQAIAAAKAHGYTEPDPRDDLGGQDVMRKILILGRMAGWPLEAADLQVESLYPASLAEVSVADFMAATPQLDTAMAARISAAREKGQVLRYVARVTADNGSVNLQELPAGSSLANMKYISFRTGLYNDEPLLIGGKGAGVEMTAAGVLGDMLDLVREQQHYT